MDGPNKSFQQAFSPWLSCWWDQVPESETMEPMGEHGTMNALVSMWIYLSLEWKRYNPLLNVTHSRQLLLSIPFTQVHQCWNWPQPAHSRNKHGSNDVQFPRAQEQTLPCAVLIILLSSLDQRLLWIDLLSYGMVNLIYMYITHTFYFIRILIKIYSDNEDCDKK